MTSPQTELSHITVFERDDGQRIVLEFAEPILDVIDAELLFALKQWRERRQVPRGHC